jgi:hypothetical protein
VLTFPLHSPQCPNYSLTSYAPPPTMVGIPPPPPLLRNPLAVRELGSELDPNVGYGKRVRFCESFESSVTGQLGARVKQATPMMGSSEAGTSSAAAGKPPTFVVPTHAEMAGIFPPTVPRPPSVLR